MSAAKIVSWAAVRPEGAFCTDSSRQAQQCRAISFRCSGLDRLRKGFGVRRQSVACVRQREVLPISCKAKNLGQDEFEEAVLKSDLPVLVDFWAGWCGPCKLVAPIIDWAAEDYDGKLKVYKVETDKSPKLVEKYRLYGLPTLILFKGGKQVRGSRREGAISKDKLKSYLDELLQSAAA